MECTVFVVDVEGLGDDWEKAFVYMEHVMLSKVQAQRKTDYTAVTWVHGRRSNTGLPGIWTSGAPRAPLSLAEARDWMVEFYEECVKQEQGEESQVEKVAGNSVFDALLYTAVELGKFVGRRKGKPKVILVTCNSPNANSEEIQIFRDQFVGELVVAGPGILEKSEEWHELADRVCTLDALVQSVADPRPKLVRPVRVWQGDLRLGAIIGGSKSEDDSVEDAIYLQVDGFPATKGVASIHRKVMGVNRDRSDLEQSSPVYRDVKAITEYTIGDEETDAIETKNNKDTVESKSNSSQNRSATVSKEHIVRAYRYGADYVDLPRSLDHQRLWHEASHIDIRGFIPLDRLSRHFLMGESMYIIPGAKTSRANNVAFCALVDSLISTKRLLLARMISKSGNSVQMCCMAPLRMLDRRRNEMRVLVMCRLPLSEDERVSAFPRLTREGVSPSAGDMAMSKFVDEMTINDEGKERKWYESALVAKYTDLAVEQGGTIPLPTATVLDSSINVDDPLSLPAIAQHRQQQIVLECAHQRYVMGRSDYKLLTIPPLSAKISEKIEPRYAPMEIVQAVATAFPLKKREKINTRDPRINPWERELDEQEEEGLDLDALLALGARS